jgi:glycosyltransferase involved in cell wall biosynthesis
MLFSVVIPAYNRLEFLPRTLESVFAQTFTDFEVIVADDGSTDGTREYLQANQPRVKTVTGKNGGPGAARNLGLAAAQGEYVVFIDSDDVWFPWTLQAAARLIAGHRPTIIAMAVQQFREESELTLVHEGPVDYTAYRDFLDSSASAHLAGSSALVVSRADAARVGGFTTERINGEDCDFNLRLGTAPGYIVMRSPIGVGWRRHPASATHNLDLAIAGARYLVSHEHNGAYDGGAARARQRREILTRVVRPISVAAAKAGLASEAFEMYRQTFRWHLMLGRWYYLLGFPALTTWHAIN